MRLEPAKGQEINCSVAQAGKNWGREPKDGGKETDTGCGTWYLRVAELGPKAQHLRKAVIESGTQCPRGQETGQGPCPSAQEGQDKKT